MQLWEFKSEKRVCLFSSFCHIITLTLHQGATCYISLGKTLLNLPVYVFYCNIKLYETVDHRNLGCLLIMKQSIGNLIESLPRTFIWIDRGSFKMGTPHKLMTRSQVTRRWTYEELVMFCNAWVQGLYSEGHVFC